MMKKVYLFILICCCVRANSQEVTLFTMENMPYTQFVNPATQSHYDWIVGVPALSSISANYNNNMFSLNEILSYSEASNSSVVDVEKLVNNFSGLGYLQSSISYSPLFFGFRNNENYYTFSLNEVVNTYNTIQQSALELVWYGNASDNETASISGTDPNIYHLREFAFGMSRKVNEKLTLGTHLKVLFGKGNIYTKSTKGYLSTDPNTYHLLADVETTIKTSLPIEVIYDEEQNFDGVQFNSDDFTVVSYLFNGSNVGLAIDVGMEYMLTDETSISASVLNFGMIRWRTTPNTFYIDEVVTFEGFESTQALDSKSELDIVVDEIMPEVSTNNYFTPMDPQVYFAASHLISNHVQLSSAAYLRLLRTKVHSAFSLSVQTANYNRVSAALSYNVSNNDYFSVGAGLGVQMGHVHLHAMTDNMLGFFNIADQRALNLRFGLSVVPKLKQKVLPVGCGCFDRWENRQ